MAETLRRHTDQIPMFTRASDLKVDCWAQWFLSHYYRDDLPDAGFFILGTAAHTGIEQAILQDLTPEDALIYAKGEAARMFDEAGGPDTVIWSKRRTAKTFDSDLELVITNWFEQVHPDSPDRFPVYNLFEWPPRVEVQIDVPNAGAYALRTTADAVFKHKSMPSHAVVDWKTGATAKSAPIQLVTYRWGLNRMGIATYKGWFHHLAAGKLQEIDQFPDNQYVEEAIKATEWVKGGKHFVPKPDWYCDYCRAQEICPVSGFDSSMPYGDMIEAIESAEDMYDPLD